MALSIGIGVGSKINVDGHVVRVKDIVNPSLMVITVDGGPDVLVTDEARIEILPEVYVFAGVGGGGHGKGDRLAFEAPRHIPIKRVEHHAYRPQGITGN